SKNVQRLLIERIVPVYRHRLALCYQGARLLATAFYRSSAAPPAIHTVIAATPGATSPETRSPNKLTFEPETRPSRAELFLNTNSGRDAQQRSPKNLPRMQNWLKDYRVGGMACLALERLLGRSRRHHMTVFLVIPPISSVQRA